MAGAVGDDFLRGEGGDDTLLGGAGNDTVGGDGGADEVRGEGGADGLFGGPGNDTLHGGTGNDTMYGGADADRFVFAPGSNFDTVNDFEDGLDILDVGALGFSSAAGFASIAPAGADVVVTFTAGHAVVLKDYLLANTLADLTDADFAFM